MMLLSDDGRWRLICKVWVQVEDLVLEEGVVAEL